MLSRFLLSFMKTQKEPMYCLAIHNNRTSRTLFLWVYDIEQAFQEAMLYGGKAREHYTFSLCEV